MQTHENGEISVSIPTMSIEDSLRLSALALTKMRVKNAPKRCVKSAVFRSEIARKSAREKCVDFAWIFCLGDSSGIHTKKIDKNKEKFHAFSTHFPRHFSRTPFWVVLTGEQSASAAQALEHKCAVTEKVWPSGVVEAQWHGY